LLLNKKILEKKSFMKVMMPLHLRS